MTSRAFRICLTIAAALVTPIAAHAQSCTLANASYSIVTYFDEMLPLTDERCTPGTPDSTGVRCRGILKGFLYVPKTRGRRPVIVWNHGSDQARLESGKADLSPHACYVAKFFVDKGFIFFSPQRRGTSLSTGVYVGDFLDKLDQGAQVADAMLGPKLMEQTDDVAAAVRYIRAHPKADRDEVAVMGHSYGGMVSLFSASKVSHIRAVIDSAGGALSWNSHPFLRHYLLMQTLAVKVPTLMMQDDKECGGDGSDPTRTLGPALPKNGSKFAIYPFSPRPCDASGAHSDFMHAEGIGLWGADVLAFLAKNGVAP